MSVMLNLWTCFKCNKDFQYKISLPYQGNKTSQLYGERLLPDELSPCASVTKLNTRPKRKKLLLCKACMGIPEITIDKGISFKLAITKNQKALESKINRCITWYRYKSYSVKDRRVKIEFFNEPVKAINIELSVISLKDYKYFSKYYLTKEICDRDYQHESFMYNKFRKDFSPQILTKIKKYLEQVD